MATLLKNVKSTVRPTEVDDTSSESTVYVRENIKEIVTVDPVFNVEKTSYEYDEYQYTWKEWSKIKTDRLEENLLRTQETIDKLISVMAEKE